MKKKLAILLILISFNFYAQVTFEKGYYINNNDEKIECFIKNFDWLNNPTSIQVKLSNNSYEKKLTIEHVKEFQVYNFSKYQRHTVDIERSVDITNDLTSERNVNFNEEELFLKVLVTGEATLYSYQDSNVYKFFYKKEKTKIKQLIYKRYFVNSTKIGKNNRFHQQLFNDVKCDKISEKEIQRLDYKTSQLTDYFIKYNKCIDLGYNNYLSKNNKANFILRIKGGINSASFSSKYSAFTLRFNNIDELSAIGYSIGSELEFPLPFNKNKWSVTLDPSYSSIKAKETFTPVLASGFPQQNPYDLEIEYNKFDFPLGIRHYMYINDNSKVYLNALLSLFIAGKIKVDYGGSPQDPEYKFNQFSSSGLGIGYSFKDTYNIEFRYESRSNDFENSKPAYKANVFSVHFSYKIF